MVAEQAEHLVAHHTIFEHFERYMVAYLDEHLVSHHSNSEQA